MSRYYPSKDKEIITGRRSKVRDLDSGEKFETSTLGEIVSLEKSNKNVNAITNHDYPPQEVVKQLRMSRYYPSKDKEIITGRRSKVRDLDSGEKFETSTLGEIVSLEKSNKNVNGLHPTSQSQFSICNRLNGVIRLEGTAAWGMSTSRRKACLQCKFYPCPTECALEHYIMKTGESNYSGHAFSYLLSILPYAMMEVLKTDATGRSSIWKCC
nr:hypothetical protein [Tanacetum cinerariifolium]